MQITAVASQCIIRMFMQMLLKEESRTFPIFKIKMVHMSDSDIKWYIPLRGATEWTAVSAGRQNFVELDSGFSEFCRCLHKLVWIQNSCMWYKLHDML